MTISKSIMLCTTYCTFYSRYYMQYISQHVAMPWGKYLFCYLHQGVSDLWFWKELSWQYRWTSFCLSWRWVQEKSNVFKIKLIPLTYAQTHSIFIYNQPILHFANIIIIIISLRDNHREDACSMNACPKTCHI